ncbi:hypothetical protein EGT07_07980 [Herbaspirillum sp. HC18]|nr:hypothetical protein EGT07_07980 [Herbaspirillum sp. HC18]
MGRQKLRIRQFGCEHRPFIHIWTAVTIGIRWQFDAIANVLSSHFHRRPFWDRLGIDLTSRLPQTTKYIR